MHSERSGREHIEFAIMLLACAFLILLTGKLLPRYDAFPYPFFDSLIVRSRVSSRLPCSWAW